MQVFAYIMLLRIPHQRPGQQAGLGQDLEAIADAQHQTAGSGKALYRLHDRGKLGQRARAQVVAVREPTRNQDCIAVLKLGGGMPKQRSLLAQYGSHGVVGIVIAVRSRKNQHPKLHTPKTTSKASPTPADIASPPADTAAATPADWSSPPSARSRSFPAAKLGTAHVRLRS